VQQGTIGMDKVIFIHIPKNGGMTIQHNDVFKSKVYIHSWKKEHRHWRYLDMKDDKIKKYKTFAIVRNPWSRIVSRFMWSKVAWPEKYPKFTSFEDFVEERNEFPTEDFYICPVRSWLTQYDYVVEEDGKINSDILRFENYNEDINLYFNLKRNVKPNNVTGYNISYKDIYTKETIQIVADWYKQDIDYWGFDFDTGATRNYWNA